MLAKEYSSKPSGQGTGQKMEIACFHISGTFWLLKIIVFCVYVCKKHINTSSYSGILSEKTYHHTTTTQQSKRHTTRKQTVEEEVSQKNVSMCVTTVYNPPLNRPLLTR